MQDFLQKLSVSRLITSLLVAIVAVVVFIILDKLCRKNLKEYKNLKDPKAVISRRVFLTLKILVIVLAFIIVSQINGINIPSAIAGLGILSAVVGLALQDYLKDIIMGVHIIVDKFFSIGDCVVYNGNLGIITAFTLTTTKIMFLSDSSVTTVCNRNITEIQKITERFYIDIPLSYNEKAESVHNLLGECAKRIENIKGVSKCIFDGTQDFLDSSVLYRIEIFCEPQNQLKIRRASLFTVQCFFEEKGIAIPFNQIDVHIDKK